MKRIREKLKSTRGAHTLEIVLVIIVLVALVVIFRQQLVSIITGVFDQLNKSINGLY